MELTKLPFPDISNRRQVTPFNLHRGSVVAFKTNDCEQRTGIIVMNNDYEMLVAYNLYKEPGNIWVEDLLPGGLILYEANEEEKRAGYLYFFKENADANIELADCILKFVSSEVRYRGHFYSREYGYRGTELFSFIPQFLNDQQRVEVSERVREKVLESGGAQFDRHQAEGECFLLAVLMIYNSVKDESQRRVMIHLLQDKWSCIVIMYGICMGRVLSFNFPNIVSVFNNLKNPEYVGYLHLYLPIAERCIDKCCAHYDNKIKLQNAINTLNRLESDHEQKTDLDELYGVLFPIFFQEAMSKSRPAATTAELKKEIAELKKELAKNLEDSQSRDKELERSFEKLMKGSVSFDEIEKNVMELPTTIAVDLLSKLLLTFKGDPDKQDGINKIIAKVIDKANYEQHSTVYNYAPGATHMDYSKKISIETKDFNEPKLLNHE